jgi:disulfide bond formation protein DsbB
MITPQTASLFFALLALAANAIVLGALVLGIAAVVSERGRAFAVRTRDEVAPAAIWLAWIIATVSTLGSLYFSEVANYPPCKLCWFQRIGMYPLSAVLLIAALRRDDSGGRWYGGALALLFLPVSAYHYLIEWFPRLDAAACDPTTPCTLIWFRRFGFVTIPYMALSGFAAIAVLLIVARTPRRRALSEEQA